MNSVVIVLTTGVKNVLKDIMMQLVLYVDKYMNTGQLIIENQLNNTRKL